MKEGCKECRYCVIASVESTGQKVDTLRYMKDKIAPKNACKFWRPRKPEETNGT
jgi:hypothetical protein